MGAEEDHQLHKTEESYSRKVSKTPGDFNYGAHTPTVPKSQDNLEAVDRRANEPFPMTASYSSQEEQAMRTEEWHPPGTSEARVQKAEEWKEKQMQAAEWTDEHM